MDLIPHFHPSHQLAAVLAALRLLEQGKQVAQVAAAGGKAERVEQEPLIRATTEDVQGQVVDGTALVVAAALALLVPTASVTELRQTREAATAATVSLRPYRGLA